MKKIVVSLLSIALLAIVGSVVYASADEGSNLEERFPNMEERHPNLSDEEVEERFHSCHRYGSFKFGNKYHYYEGRDGDRNSDKFRDEYKQMPPRKDNRGFGRGHGFGHGHNMMQ